MAYTTVNRLKNVYIGVDYLMSEEGHDGSKERNVVVGSVNMIPDGMYYRQFLQELRRVDRLRHPTQAISIIQSFSAKEMNPENYDDIALANEIGTMFASEFYPGRRALICTQIDGKSGLVHNHILVSDAHMETLKGCDRRQYHAKTVMKKTNEVAGRYIKLDFGEKAKDKSTKTERVRREKGQYVYKDDIRARIRKALIETDFEPKFPMICRKHGVDVAKKHSDKYGDYYTFTLTDLSNVPEGTKLTTTKARSYKLGDDYSPISVERTAQLNYSARVNRVTEMEMKEIDDELEDAFSQFKQPTVPVEVQVAQSEEFEEIEEKESDKEEAAERTKKMRDRAKKIPKSGLSAEKKAELLRRFSSVPGVVDGDEYGDDQYD